VARSLPTIKINGKLYYVDNRLGQYRNVENPHDFIEMDNDRLTISDIDESGEETLSHVGPSQEELLEHHNEGKCSRFCGYCYEEACASK